MALDNFDRLEEGLGRLLAEFEAIKAENRGLKEVLKAKEAEVGTLNDRIGKLDKEKGIVKEKVDTLLEKLEGLIQKA
jgi:predicted nuclease with TOPRIM domain